MLGIIAEQGESRAPEGMYGNVPYSSFGRRQAVPLQMSIDSLPLLPACNLYCLLASTELHPSQSAQVDRGSLVYIAAARPGSMAAVSYRNREVADVV